MQIRPKALPTARCTSWNSLREWLSRAPGCRCAPHPATPSNAQVLSAERRKQFHMPRGGHSQPLTKRPPQMPPSNSRSPHCPSTLNENRSCISGLCSDGLRFMHASKSQVLPARTGNACPVEEAAGWGDVTSCMLGSAATCPSWLLPRGSQRSMRRLQHEGEKGLPHKSNKKSCGMRRPTSSGKACACILCHMKRRACRLIEDWLRLQVSQELHLIVGQRVRQPWTSNCECLWKHRVFFLVLPIVGIVSQCRPKASLS